VRRAIALMEDSLEEPLDIAGVAQKLALSPSYFSTIFTEETGRNPSDFLIDLRLERAKEYLAHTEMSVMEVSVALGYSRSYFTRLFNERIGCSPGVFARRTRVQH
jgi:two-component system response regulator YesN